MPENRTNIEAWLHQAEIDLRVAEKASQDDEEAAWAIYLAQQAAEKSLKGFLLFSNIPYKRTHDLSYLHKLCTLNSPTFQDLSAWVDTLQQHGAELRYPADDELPITLDEAKAAIKAASSILLFIRNKIQEPLE